ncbi:MAG: tyrosine-type recombinase/integrase [Xanthomonadaceae bacterium]|nr:tyrosine-type recombinase/integrase [Xanthomonadaceae bacterium]
MNALAKIQTHIYERKYSNGTRSWRVRWKSPVTSDWKAITAGKSKNDALLLEAKIRQFIAEGKDPVFYNIEKSELPTVSNIVDLFLEHPRFNSGSEKWKQITRYRIENKIRPILGDKIFSHLKTTQIIELYLSLKNEGMSRSSIIKLHTLMCLLGDLFTENHPDQINPVRKFKDFNKYFPNQAPNREINFLTPEDTQKLIKTCQFANSPLLQPLVQFLSYTGMRRNEALNLKWTDIDLQTGFIIIRKSKNGKSRTIPLEPEALHAIISLKSHSEEFVFSYTDGSRPHESSFLRPLQRAARKAGIAKRIDLHTLRQSYGSNKIRQGWGLKKVSIILGHSDISITSNVYTHLLDGDLKVRDEFHFDKTLQSENSLDRGAIYKMVSEAISRLIVDENPSAIALTNTSNRLKSLITGLSRNDLGSAGTKSEKTSHVPLMYRNEVARNDQSTDNNGVGKNSNHIGDLKFIKWSG